MSTKEILLDCGPDRTFGRAAGVLFPSSYLELQFNEPAISCCYNFILGIVVIIILIIFRETNSGVDPVLKQ